MVDGNVAAQMPPTCDPRSEADGQDDLRVVLIALAEGVRFERWATFPTCLSSLDSTSWTGLTTFGSTPAA